MQIRKPLLEVNLVKHTQWKVPKFSYSAILLLKVHPKRASYACAYVFVFIRTCVLSAKLLQLCPTLCDPMDCRPPGASIHGILQARHWNGLLCPPPGNLPNPGIKPVSLMSPALAGGFFTARAIHNAAKELAGALIGN